MKSTNATILSAAIEKSEIQAVRKLADGYEHNERQDSIVYSRFRDPFPKCGLPVRSFRKRLERCVLALVPPNQVVHPFAVVVSQYLVLAQLYPQTLSVQASTVLRIIRLPPSRLPSFCFNRRILSRPWFGLSRSS